MAIFVAAVWLAVAAPPPAAATPVDAEDDERRIALMLSADPKSRAIAFTVGQSWMATDGVAGRERYRRLLFTAWQRADAGFDRERRAAATAAGLFRSTFGHWKVLSSSAADAVQAETHSAAGPVAVLDGHLDGATRAYADLAPRLEAALRAVERATASGNILLDLRAQIARLEGGPAPARSLRGLLAAEADGRGLLAAEPDLLEARRLRDLHFAAAQHNAGQAWAPPGARQFAALLNGRRAALGLDPLHLERQLWRACADHVAEMRQLRYFDHHSPTVERRTPELRAALAQFSGQFVGENLFRSDRPQPPASVLRSWWVSDGHRRVLFASTPDTVGLDPADGTHWALMTGKM